MSERAAVQQSDRGPTASGDKPLRPAEVCGELLATIDAAEGRRKRRARNTTADAIGLGIRRELLEEVCAADPDPDDFEGWLLERCLREGLSDGPVRAMALTIWEEWRLASTAGGFRQWLNAGAPSDDRESPPGDRDASSEGVVALERRRHDQ